MGDKVSREARDEGIYRGYPDYIFDDPQMMPYFDNSTNKVETIEPHQTVYLHCIVKQIGNKSVSIF